MTPAGQPGLKAALTRAWPHLRAAFVCFHVLAVALAASPSLSSALSRNAWSDPTVRAELQAWAGRFGMEEAPFTEALWEAANTYQATRTSLLAPLRPYFRYAEVSQSWQMFVAPHTNPTRMHLEEQVGGQWRPLFVERSDEHVWMRAPLETERLRASIFRWGWPNYQGAFKQACRALAARRFAETAEPSAFRCRFHKARTPSAAEVLAGETPEGRWVYTQLVTR